MRRGGFVLAVMVCACLTGLVLAYRAAPLPFWAGILASALLGALFPGSFMLARTAVTGLRRNSMLLGGLGTLVGAAVLGVLTFRIMEEPARKQMTDLLFRSIEAQQPLLATMREYEPNLYRSVRSRLEVILRERGNSDDVATRVQPLIAAAVRAKAPALDDAMLGEIIDTTLSQARELRSEHPDKCVAILLGRPAPSLLSSLGETSRRMQIDLLERVLRAPRNPNVAVATAEEAADAVAQVVVEAARRLATTPEQLSASLQGTGDDAQVCAALTTTMEVLRSIPDPYQMPALRFVILSDQSEI